MTEQSNCGYVILVYYGCVFSISFTIICIYFINLLPKMNNQPFDVIVTWCLSFLLKFTENAKQTVTDEDWHSMGGKKWWLKYFWLPPEPPVASARWWSWKSVCGEGHLTDYVPTHWGCIWCIKSLFMLPLCKRQPPHFSFFFLFPFLECLI